MSTAGFPTNVALFCATFAGLTVLSAAGFSAGERLVIVLVTAAIYGGLIRVLDSRSREK